MKLNRVALRFPHLTLPSPRRVPIALAQWEPGPGGEGFFERVKLALSHKFADGAVTGGRTVALA